MSHPESAPRATTSNLPSGPGVKPQGAKASPAAAARPEGVLQTASPSLRRYLYLTAAVCGGAVMIVEILGAKMLSPFLGLSHFVWTAQIAVTLVALACGYYAGGRLADSSRRLAVLYWAILGAALYLALTVVVCEPVAYWCLDFNSLALGSLLASTILFFIPLACLAMTSPFLVRFITASLEGVGSSVGRLSSISTLGSFAGTLLIGYLMIPYLPNSITMFATAAVLALVAVIFFAVFRPKALVGALLLMVGFGAATGYRVYHRWTPHYSGVDQRFRGNSHFGQLQVLDRKDGSERFYLNDFLVQNTFDPETKQSMSHFTYMLSGLARANVTNIQDVLCIGLGVGIVPMDFARQGARVDVVEINPAVVPVGQRFFNLDTNLIHLTIDDGRHFLNRCHKQYDAIILDAFLGDSSPSHLMTREAFRSMRKALRPGGALVMNSFGDLSPGRDFFTTSLNQTLKAVFPAVRMHTSGDGGMFFASTIRKESGFVRPPDLTNIHASALLAAREAFGNVVELPVDRGRVLTDNYNPAEFYDAANREVIRRRLALGARPD